MEHEQLDRLREQISSAIVGERRWTKAEVAAASGVALPDADALWRAMGFAQVDVDERVFTDRDVEALRQVAFLLDNGVVDAGALAAMTRTMAQSLARLAVAHNDLATEHLARTGAATIDEQVLAAGTAAEHLLPAASSLLDYIWRRHLASAAESAALALLGDQDQVAAVGFADLEGFTELSRRLSGDELAAVVDRFEDEASALVSANGGRVVKLLGDEAMFTNPGLELAARTALALARPGDEERPGIKVGLAWGPVLSRLGDVYGPTVNLASRLTGIARPGSVLLDRDAAAALEAMPGWRVQPLRRRSVRGYANLAPYLLREVR